MNPEQEGKLIDELNRYKKKALRRRREIKRILYHNELLREINFLSGVISKVT